MTIELLASTADVNYFTGFESVRIQNLLLFLSILSLAVWALVITSMLIRYGAKIFITHRSHSRNSRR